MKALSNIFSYSLYFIAAFLLFAFTVSVVIGRKNISNSKQVKRQQIVDYAQKFLMVENLVEFGYRLDCSGYTVQVFRKFGIKLPRSSKQQFNVFLIQENEPQMADLVFFTEDSHSVSHVGIMLTDSTFIHSPGKKKKVRVDYLSNLYWKKRLIGVKTVLENH